MSAPVSVEGTDCVHAAATAVRTAVRYCDAADGGAGSVGVGEEVLGVGVDEIALSARAFDKYVKLCRQVVRTDRKVVVCVGVLVSVSHSLLSSGAGSCCCDVLHWQGQGQGGRVGYVGGVRGRFGSCVGGEGWGTDGVDSMAERTGDRDRGRDQHRDRDRDREEEQKHSIKNPLLPVPVLQS